MLRTWSCVAHSAPMLMRPPSRAFMAIRKPCARSLHQHRGRVVECLGGGGACTSPSLPMRLVLGMRTFSKITARVGCEFQPN